MFRLASACQEMKSGTKLWQRNNTICLSPRAVDLPRLTLPENSRQIGTVLHPFTSLPRLVSRNRIDVLRTAAFATGKATAH
jgi:hypothetical protein